MIAALGYVAFRAGRARREQTAVRARADAALAARADEQHKQYLAGEPRGLYGGFEPARFD